MSKPFAAGTTVEAAKSRAEIEVLLNRRGCSKFATMSDSNVFHMAFELDGVAYKLELPLPDPQEDRFWKYKLQSVWKVRTESGAQGEYEKELNRRWRAFFAVIKAKIIAVEEGISTMEREFIGSAMVGGSTIADQYAPRIKELARNGQLPPLALGGGNRG